MTTHPNDPIAGAWLQAGRELGFSVTAPFQLHTQSGDAVDYAARVEGFGSPKGMLILTDSNARDAVFLAVSRGYGYSCLNWSYAKFDRQRFIDSLNDWGWTGQKGDAPEWYSGPPSEEDYPED